MNFLSKIQKLDDTIIGDLEKSAGRFSNFIKAIPGSDTIGQLLRTSGDVFTDPLQARNVNNILTQSPAGQSVTRTLSTPVTAENIKSAPSAFINKIKRMRMPGKNQTTPKVDVDPKTGKETMSVKQDTTGIKQTDGTDLPSATNKIDVDSKNLNLPGSDSNYLSGMPSRPDFTKNPMNWPKALLGLANQGDHVISRTLRSVLPQPRTLTSGMETGTGRSIQEVLPSNQRNIPLFGADNTSASASALRTLFPTFTRAGGKVLDSKYVPGGSSLKKFLTGSGDAAEKTINPGGASRLYNSVSNPATLGTATGTGLIAGGMYQNEVDKEQAIQGDNLREATEEVVPMLNSKLKENKELESDLQGLVKEIQGHEARDTESFFNTLKGTGLGALSLPAIQYFSYRSKVKKYAEENGISEEEAERRLKGEDPSYLVGALSGAGLGAIGGNIYDRLSQPESE